MDCCKPIVLTQWIVLPDLGQYSWMVNLKAGVFRSSSSDCWRNLLFRKVGQEAKTAKDQDRYLNSSLGSQTNKAVMKSTLAKEKVRMNLLLILNAFLNCIFFDKY